jgi:hypothetical protein
VHCSAAAAEISPSQRLSCIKSSITLCDARPAVTDLCFFSVRRLQARREPKVELRAKNGPKEARSQGWPAPSSRSEARDSRDVLTTCHAMPCHALALCARPLQRPSGPHARTVARKMRRSGKIKGCVDTTDLTAGGSWLFSTAEEIGIVNHTVWTELHTIVDLGMQPANPALQDDLGKRGVTGFEAVKMHAKPQRGAAVKSLRSLGTPLSHTVDLATSENPDLASRPRRLLSPSASVSQIPPASGHCLQTHATILWPGPHDNSIASPASPHSREPSACPAAIQIDPRPSPKRF